MKQEPRQIWLPLAILGVALVLWAGMLRLGAFLQMGRISRITTGGGADRRRLHGRVSRRLGAGAVEALAEGSDEQRLDLLGISRLFSAEHP